MPSVNRFGTRTRSNSSQPVGDVLEYMAGLKGMTRADARREASRWLERLGLGDAGARKVEQLSKGNQQKVQYIATILHGPDVLLIDEPFSGLDPVNVALLKAALLEMRDRGKTVVFSTHQLEMAEELCEDVAIIDHGRLVEIGPTRDVRRSTGHQVIRLATARRHAHTRHRR